MEYTIFDIKADNLLDKVSKIHCLCYRKYKGDKLLCKDSVTSYSQISHIIRSSTNLVGHNIIRYDIPVIEKVLGIRVNKNVIDTLMLSWYLYPTSKFRHGLEFWGDRLGVNRLEVRDNYRYLCELDLDISDKLFKYLDGYISDLYGGDTSRIYNYLSFKGSCIRDQEFSGIPLDRYKLKKYKYALEYEIEEKTSLLRSKMPKVVIKERPEKMYKGDNTLTVIGKKWLEELRVLNLSKDSRYIYKEGNPLSSAQLKDWLFKLGWEPITFKDIKGKRVPQISCGEGLCSSVKALIKEHPYLSSLEGLYTARHRLGVIKSFFKVEGSKVYALAHGLTSTLRLQHSSPIANLPSVRKYYGKEIRGLLIAPEGDYIMCGSDIINLEDKTKQHFIYKYDKEYVRQMQVKGFDSHIDIGVLSGIISEYDGIFYNSFNYSTGSLKERRRYEDIKERRERAKTVNFSAIYGAGINKLRTILKCTQLFAERLYKVYWERNKSIKQVVDSIETKVLKLRYSEVVDQKWIKNPVSNFWIFLKSDKDKFSTLNQNMGVYIFDCWLREVRIRLRLLKIVVLLQYHDEIAFICKVSDKDRVEKILLDSIDKVNKDLGLNVEIGISISFGKSYAKCH